MNNMQMEMEIEMHEAAEKDLYALERLESVGDQDPSFIPAKEDEDLWLDRDPGDLLGVDDDSSIFYTDFLALPDFPCVSSSSSSSPSNPPQVNTSACVSSASSCSSSSLWNNMDATVRESEQEHEPLLWSGDSMEIPESFDPQIDVDCINVMQELGDMDILDTNGIWESVGMEKPEVEQQQKEEEHPYEDLGMMFLEWLKSNKESISAEDLRSIKLKRSTIECAAQRLGGGKEGMTQLLKLILEWVQNHHLHKRPMRSGGTEAAEVSSPSPSPNPYPPQNCFQNPNPLSLESNLCYSSTWVPHQSLYADQTANVGFPPMMGYTGGGGDPGFGNGSGVFCQPDYPMVNGAATWATPPLPQPHFPLYNSYRDQNVIPVPPQVQLFGSGRNHYPSGSTPLMQGTGERLVNMGPSATKEARKKRMARQKRFLSHHRSQNQNHLHHHQQQYSSSTADQEQQQEARIASDANCTTSSHDNPAGNWAFWPSSETSGAVAAATITSMEPSDVAAVAAATPFSDRPTLQPHHQRQFNSERRQGLKQEKNLKFLLQKVLKQSDVGNLGRIVLPKKEAEMHLPELEARDGISIAMEDIVTSRIWNMRYRFWPNNKSRMYLLENTGDFVRSNGLQEGDFIVIYSDVKCGKYMIRGVKVPQQGCKMEPKRGGKQQRNLHATLPSADCDNGLSSSSPMKEIMS